jgi:quercetin dioxygenase-like cupin family protein
MTTTVHLQTAANELLDSLRQQPSGRAARTLSAGAHAPLKQTLLALEAGHRLQDHRTAGMATIELLIGRVRLTVGTDERIIEAGHWASIPAEVHGLVADEDSVALLTVARRPSPTDVEADR